MPIILTEKAAEAVRRIMSETMAAESARVPVMAGGGDSGSESLPRKLHLRVRVVGGGCSGFTNKLDLDPDVNEKLDEVFEIHGVPLVVDKRSLMYLDGAKIDFHDDLNKTGFSITNPSAKSTCGCGSSWSM